MEKTLKAKSLLLIILCGFCWGPSYFFIKIAVPEIPPITLILARLVIGAIPLLAVCLYQKTKWSDCHPHWKQLAILGMLLNAVPFVLIAYSELYIPSSLAGILNSLTLIFTAIISHFFSFERLTQNKILGIVSGLTGLCFIYLPFLWHEQTGSEIGVLLMILATLSYGAGTVYARVHIHRIPRTIALTGQLLIAALILLPFSILIDHPTTMPSLKAISGALGLGIIGTAIGFFFYYKAIEIAGATYASFATLLIPLVAIILGVMFLHEHLAWNAYVGVLLILAGVIGVNPAIKKNIL